MRLANHSPAVVPPVWNFAFSGFRMASATISLNSAIGSRIPDSPGRVKNTRDQRTCLLCSPGGCLNGRYKVSGFGWVQGNFHLHHTVQVRSQYTSAEDRHRVSCKIGFNKRTEGYREGSNRDYRSRVRGSANCACSQPLHVSSSGEITLTCCHSSVPGTMTWRPPSRLCRKDCKLSN